MTMATEFAPAITLRDVRASAEVTGEVLEQLARVIRAGILSASSGLDPEVYGAWPEGTDFRERRFWHKIAEAALDGSYQLVLKTTEDRDGHAERS
jgi:hypothetical protein